MSTRRPRSPASSSTSPGSKHLEPLFNMLQLDEADPSTLPFLRGYAVGFTATIVPALVRILLGVRKRGFAQVLKALVKAFGQALDPRGVAMAMGVAFGGAKWGDSRVEGVVRAAYLASLRRLRARRKGKGPRIEELPEDEEVTESYLNQHEPRIKALSTYISATISALVAITLLQSRSSARSTRAAVPTELDLGVSPYPSLDTSSLPSTPRPSARPAVSSPTLDLTLFVFVRASKLQADQSARSALTALLPTSRRPRARNLRSGDEELDDEGSPRKLD